jgi:hypothetical protein
MLSVDCYLNIYFNINIVFLFKNNSFSLFRMQNLLLSKILAAQFFSRGQKNIYPQPSRMKRLRLDFI